MSKDQTQFILQHGSAKMIDGVIASDEHRKLSHPAFDVAQNMGLKTEDVDRFQKVFHRYDPPNSAAEFFGAHPNANKESFDFAIQNPSKRYRYKMITSKHMTPEHIDHVTSVDVFSKPDMMEEILYQRPGTDRTPDSVFHAIMTDPEAYSHIKNLESRHAYRSFLNHPRTTPEHVKALIKYGTPKKEGMFHEIAHNPEKHEIYSPETKLTPDVMETLKQHTQKNDD